MALERRYCHNHPDRMAMGVCVETGRPICGECSTRYNGVNYSREGLEIMLRRRREAMARKGVRTPQLVAAWAIMSAIAFFLYYLLGRVLTIWLSPS